MIITDAAVRNRATVSVLVILIVLAGLYAYPSLPREAAPDVAIPIVLITTSYEGVSPEDIETSISMKIEKELAGLKGLKEIRSSSAEGMSTITVEFQPDIIIEDALQYVRDRVELAKGDLPSEAEEPFIKEINIAEFPIMMISLSGDLSPVRLKAIADELEDRIEQVPGVLNADISGELEREIRIEVDADRVTAYDLTLPEILAVIPSENVNISAGGLDTEGTRFNVRVPAEFVDPGEVDHLVLAVRDGNPVYLRDVAAIVDTFKDRWAYSRLDGNPSITIAVQKRIGADITRLTLIVKHILAEARKRLPKGVKLEVTSEDAKYIDMMVSDLENNIASGFILVMAVLVLFLGWRTSLIVALAIPMSMLISFTAIMAMGYTLNMIILFSLVLALGMMVDNAIVIVENIYRHMQLGYDRTRAAILGTREVAWPVATSTATTIAAFFPLLFWPGIMGDFMKYLPIGVITTLSSSLFVALIINPTICGMVASGKMKTLGDHAFLRAYQGVLQLAMRYRKTTFALSGLLLVAIALLYVKLGKGMEFFPKGDPEYARFNLRLPQGTNIRETDRLTRVVEERVEPFRDKIKNMVTEVGSGAGMFHSGPHSGNVTLVFPDYKDRERPSAETLAEMRALLADLPGAEAKLSRSENGPPTGSPINAQISGDDFRTLQALSEKAKRMIADVPGLVNLRSDLEVTKPELVFRVDRQRAKLLGVNTQVVGRFLKTAIFGSNVGTYRQFNDEYDIKVRLPLDRRTDIQKIFSLRVPNNRGDSVPLSSLGTLAYEGGYGTINRIDQKRVVSITADNEGRQTGAVLGDVQKRLAGLKLPPGYTIAYVGENEEQEKAQAFLMKAFLLALLLIVMILVTQFNSFQVPFIIIITVLLSLIGVLVGLLFCRLPFGVIMTGVGVISLAGVVVNNAIVLLDYTRQLQRRGRDLWHAVVEAGKTRLRPVLLTAVTTILGLVPMATGVSFDFRSMQLVTRSQSSEWWSGMAIAVIFGLAFATILTLVVVPTLYYSMHSVAQSFGMGGIRKKDAAI
ncbi:MAG: efflux RND transporter permease subunit [Planctomycetota bacterium]|jgi:multidrug efflux pump subunit AcrB